MNGRIKHRRGEKAPARPKPGRPAPLEKSTPEQLLPRTDDEAQEKADPERRSSVLEAVDLGNPAFGKGKKDPGDRVSGPKDGIKKNRRNHAPKDLAARFVPNIGPKQGRKIPVEGRAENDEQDQGSGHPLPEIQRAETFENEKRNKKEDGRSGRGKIGRRPCFPASHRRFTRTVQASRPSGAPFGGIIPANGRAITRPCREGRSEDYSGPSPHPRQRSPRDFSAGAGAGPAARGSRPRGGRPA